MLATMAPTVNTNVTSARPQGQQQTNSGAKTLSTPQSQSLSREPSNVSNRNRPVSQSPLRGSGPAAKPQPRTRTPAVQEPSEPDDAKWGSNFWVTLVDPQVCRVKTNLAVSRTDGCMSDANIVFCLPCHRASKLGSASGPLRVRVSMPCFPPRH